MSSKLLSPQNYVDFGNGPSLQLILWLVTLWEIGKAQVLLITEEWLHSVVYVSDQAVTACQQQRPETEWKNVLQPSFVSYFHLWKQQNAPLVRLQIKDYRLFQYLTNTVAKPNIKVQVDPKIQIQSLSTHVKFCFPQNISELRIKTEVERCPKQLK